MTMAWEVPQTVEEREELWEWYKALGQLQRERLSTAEGTFYALWSDTLFQGVR